MQDLSDDELMRLYREGSHDAFRTLFERYRAPVYNLARIMLNDPCRAEDLLQEAFVAVARAARRYEPRGRFRSWLLRIVRNRCLNLLESDRVRRAIAVEGDPWVEPSARASSRVETAEQMTLVRKAIAGLPDRQREALTLYAFDCMSYQEIATVLDMPINTVKTMIHRGRAALARAVEEAQEERL
jgi:RNA polymerase sigma-70 factor (ECF subfamily)